LEDFYKVQNFALKSLRWVTISYFYDSISETQLIIQNTRFRETILSIEIRFIDKPKLEILIRYVIIEYTGSHSNIVSLICKSLLANSLE